MRSLHWEERMRLFRTAVRKYQPQLVVLDGVRDLLADINDGIRAQEVMDELFYEALKAGPLYYSDLQKRVQTLLNCGSPMWNNMFQTMRDKGAIVRVINHEGRAVWQLQSFASTTMSPSQPDLFDLPPNSRA